MQFLRGFVRCVDAAIDFIGKTTSFLIYPTMLVLVYEVVMRYYFTRPTIWAHETSCMLYGAHFVIGGAYALQRGAFVNVEVLYIRLSKRGRAVLDLITWTMFYVFVGTLLWKSIPWAWESFTVREFSDSTWGPYVWPIKMAIPFASLLMLLQGMTKTIKDAYLAVTGRDFVVAADAETAAGN
ncbi:TRAP transporter small permease subunit [Aminivibrio pyruvatiphilus]|nr:TRAP transporter small permease subunit [Aminivibrio pyruvatiphilus]